MSPISQDQYFYQVWQAFVSNLGALRLFSQEASLHADQLDRTRIHELANEMADMFGDNPHQVEKELLEFTPPLDNLEIFPDPRQDPKVREMLKDFKTTRFKSRVLEWALENPRSAYKLSDLFTDYLAHPPINLVVRPANPQSPTDAKWKGWHPGHRKHPHGPEFRLASEVVEHRFLVTL